MPELHLASDQMSGLVQSSADRAAQLSATVPGQTLRIRATRPIRGERVGTGSEFDFGRSASIFSARFVIEIRPASRRGRARSLNCLSYRHEILLRHALEHAAAR